MKRKEFIGLSALASATLFVPEFLRASAASNLLQQQAVNGRKLVVIQLSGGNDGLNTVIPFRNDLYYKLRPTLAIKSDKVLTLNDELGLHESLTGMKQLFDNGMMTILNNVGYPNPNRSHFRSMDIWHTASDSNQYLNTGWIGRYLDASCAGCALPTGAIEIDDSLSLALKGEQVKGLALHNINLFDKLAGLANTFKDKPAIAGNDNLNYLYKTLVETKSSVAYLQEKSKVYKSKEEYPKNPLGNDLKTIAELIVSDISTTVFYTALGGFDTHANQLGEQTNNLKKVSESVSAFVADLKKNNRFDDVVIMVFSEFGRRVKQNGSNGTDHGTANNVFLISSKLNKTGVFNSAPDLEKLEEGDLVFNTDFRSIYATLLNKWLQSNDEAILGKQFEKLNFL